MPLAHTLLWPWTTGRAVLTRTTLSRHRNNAGRPCQRYAHIPGGLWTCSTLHTETFCLHKPCAPARRNIRTLHPPNHCPQTSDLGRNARNGPVSEALKAAFAAGAGSALTSSSWESKLVLRTREWHERCRQSILTRQIPSPIRKAQQRRSATAGNLEIIASCIIRHLVTIHQTGQNVRSQTAVFKASSQQLVDIRRAGYSQRQLQSWAQALLEPDFKSAARQIFGMGDEVPKKLNAPTFVLLGFLRRQYIDHSTVSFLLSHLAALSETTSSTFRPEMSTAKSRLGLVEETEHHILLLETISMLFEAYCHLFRHARRMWPEVLDTLAINFTASLKLLMSRYDSVIHRPFALLQPFLTFICNEVLSQIAAQCAVSPYRSAEHQQKAHNTVLQYMSSLPNNLALSMDGYRAVMRVQLMLPKTAHEQAWAQLKSPSWPPWKRDRTGLDGLIGPEYGISRAGNVAAKAKEAGFGLGTWDSAATIYSGWDTDGSPTIQSRATMPYLGLRGGDSHIWSARIRSTRTLQEAWACFLASEGHVAADSNMYHAMLEKSQLEQKRLRMLGASEVSAGLQESTIACATDQAVVPTELRIVMPGDAKEIDAPPANVQYETFTQTPPPTPEEVIQQMRADQVAPSPSALASLVRGAVSMDAVYQHLAHTSRRPALYKPLLEPNSSVFKRLRSIPKPVLTAVVGRLVMTDKRLSDRSEGYMAIGNVTLDIAHPVIHAYRLVVSGIMHRPAVDAMLKSLSSRANGYLVNAMQEVIPAKMSSQALDRVMCAHLARNLLSGMDRQGIVLDVNSFISLCKVMSCAARVARRLGDSVKEPHDRSALDTMIALEADNGHYIHDRFCRLVGSSRRTLRKPDNMTHDASSGPMATTLVSTVSTSGTDLTEHLRTHAVPRLFAYPSPAVLHAYIRALGASRDYNNIVELAHWMREYWPEVQQRMGQDRRGAPMLRQVLVAMRAFLQGRPRHIDENMHWTELAYHQRLHDESRTAEAVGKAYEAPVSFVLDAMAVVDSIDAWGGWPSYQEACTYHERDLVGV